MKFHVYKDAKGEWRWRLTAKNGRIIADSGEGYRRKATAVKACINLIDNVQSASMQVEGAQRWSGND